MNDHVLTEEFIEANRILKKLYPHAPQDFLLNYRRNYGVIKLINCNLCCGLPIDIDDQGHMKPLEHAQAHYDAVKNRKMTLVDFLELRFAEDDTNALMKYFYPGVLTDLPFSIFPDKEPNWKFRFNGVIAEDLMSDVRTPVSSWGRSASTENGYLRRIQCTLCDWGSHYDSGIEHIRSHFNERCTDHIQWHVTQLEAELKLL